MWDCIVIGIISLAIYTGLRALHRHECFFQDFRIRDLLARRLDAMLYIITMGSTALCCVDVVLRTLWITEVGWATTGNKWQILWLGLHAAFGFTSTSFHLLADRLLENSDFCSLCRRPWT